MNAHLSTVFKLNKIDASFMTKCQVDIANIIQFKTPRYSDIIQQIWIQVDPLPPSSNEDCKGFCSTADKGYKWFKFDQLSPFSREQFGPDPYLYVVESSGSRSRVAEFSIQSELISHTKNWNLLVNKLLYPESGILSFFDDYVQHCYPSMFMNRQMFMAYLAKSSVSITVNSSVADSGHVFNSFCTSNGAFIMFRDFILALASLDKRCPHGSVGGEMRARCLFRFYAKSGKNVLTFDDMVTLYVDIIKNNKKAKSEDNPKACVETIYKFLKINKDQTVSMVSFIDLVGTLVIRGTAALYRSATPPLMDLVRCKVYSHLNLREIKLESIMKKELIAPKKKVKCKTCTRAVYTIGVHAIKLDKDTGVLSYAQELSADVVAKMPKAQRDQSNEMINIKNPYNLIRLILRRFSKITHGYPTDMDKSTESSLPKWENIGDRTKLVESIISICTDAVEQFKKTPRVVKLTSPVYVFGDIHGNYRDLMTYDQLFWKMLPKGYAANSLFLGDYVDRGDNCVECVLYLLIMKLLHPTMFFILRGNHESRPIQQQFTFLKECVAKFESAGTIIWESFNNVFDCMPLCAVIDEKIYCAHGGIPASESRLEYLYDIPMPLSTIQSQSQLAWEVLWNDPASRSEYKEQLELFANDDNPNKPPEGFLVNLKRGTAFAFGEEAVDNFLNQNDLSMVLRAHEAVAAGFEFHFDGKLITVFSCSNYCGTSNEAAVVYIESSKVRVIKIETTTPTKEKKATKN